MSEQAMALLAPAQVASLYWRRADGGRERAGGWLREVKADHLTLRLPDEAARPLAGQRLWLIVDTPHGQVNAPATVPFQVMPSGLLRVDLAGAPRLVQRRRHPRARIDRPLVRATPLDAAGAPGRLLYVHLADLSAGGARLASAQALEPGTRLRLDLSLHGDETIPLVLVVLACGPIRHRPVAATGAGASSRPVAYRVHGRFIGLHPDERRSIGQFVQRRRLTPWRGRGDA